MSTSSPYTSQPNDMTSVMDSFAPALVGGFISSMIYGITTLQTYMYYMHYPKDALTLKLLVAALWVLDTVHVSFNAATSFNCYAQSLQIATYGVPTSFEYVIWSMPGSVLMNVLIISAVQCFFAHQIHYLCHSKLKWWLTTPILKPVGLSSSLGCTIKDISIGSGLGWLINPNDNVATRIMIDSGVPSMALVATADVLIAVSLCVLLYERGSSSAIPSTKRLLNTLIIYTVNRCLLTSLVAIALLTMTINDQTSSAWATGLDFLVGKLYANSLLATLNSRQHLRFQSEGSLSGLRINAVHLMDLPKFPGVALNSRLECVAKQRVKYYQLKNYTTSRHGQHAIIVVRKIVDDVLCLYNTVRGAYSPEVDRALMVLVGVSTALAPVAHKARETLPVPPTESSGKLQSNSVAAIEMQSSATPIFESKMHRGSAKNGRHV
ncbi:hypothetical protein EDD17DRAFT_1899391 [Pisolithus thermaeus]|nr:hypothetical protein EDD17DRAFT_1899391 [Pisolithus thermaeus]